MPTLLPPNLAKLASIAGKDNCKYAISGVHLTTSDDGSYVASATDTRLLVRVTGKPEYPVAEYPDLAPITAAPNGHNAAIVPAVAWAKALSGKMTRRMSAKPILSQTAVVIGDKVTTFASTDLESVKSATLDNVEGRYPPVNDVIPKRPPAFVVKVDPMMLAKLLEVATAFTDDSDRKVTIEFAGDADGKPDAMRPIIVRRTNATQEFVGLCMPLT